MTREEAISVLGKYKHYAESIYTDGVLDGKAFDMAIEALLADTVSREMYDDVVQTIIKREKQFTNMVSVVRCKDCRYCTEYYDRDGYPYWECAEWDGGTDADGFCHYGERREE